MPLVLKKLRMDDPLETEVVLICFNGKTIYKIFTSGGFSSKPALNRLYAACIKDWPNFCSCVMARLLRLCNDGGIIRKTSPNHILWMGEIPQQLVTRGTPMKHSELMGSSWDVYHLRTGAEFRNHPQSY